jgi:hypothetical protein
MSYNRYLKVCKDASENEEVFKTFKSHPDYNVILEHVSHADGLKYLVEIGTEFPYLLNYMKKFATNDDIGNPRIYPCKELGMSISPTTLRYIKVLADLMNLFGRLDGMDIVEVGGGYGGQCKIINDMTEFSSYTLVDLPEVLILNNKYLERHGIKNVILRDVEDTSEIHYDLFISNYSFTEIEHKYQDLYAEKIIKNSDRGYITCNFLGQRGDGGMSKDEVFALKPNGQFIPEKPLTAPNNLIYIWR